MWKQQNMYVFSYRKKTSDQRVFTLKLNIDNLTMNSFD